MGSLLRSIGLAGVATIGVGCSSGPAEATASLGFVPSLTIDALPDTVFGRFVVATAHTNGLAVKDAALLIDAAAASPQSVGSAICQGVTLPGDYYWCNAHSSNFVGPESWTLYGPKALANGPHILRLDVVDTSGRAVSAQGSFVTYVPDIEYTATILDAGSMIDATALDINVSGMVAGWVRNAGGQYAATWSASGTLTLLDTAGSEALAMNDTGDVVGISGNRPMLWSRGVRTELPGFGTATAINNLGVVGITRGHTSVSFWRNGVVTDLGGCFSATVPIRLCTVSALNDRGQAVGATLSAHGNEVVGGYQIEVSFPNPPASVTPFPNASSIVLNNAGQYAGSVSSARSALFYGGDGKPSRLLAAEFGLGNVDNAVDVRDLNDAGDLLVFERTSHTAYLMRGGRVSRVHLAESNVRIDDVTALNASATIVGHGTNMRTGQIGAIVLRRR